MWRSYKIPTKQRELSVSRINVQRDRVLISAVATLEPKISTENNAHDVYHRLHVDTDSETPQRAEHQSLSEDFTELDDKEKLRRKRISKANKGNTPWNKGRKHTPGTYQQP